MFSLEIPSGHIVDFPVRAVKALASLSADHNAQELAQAKAGVDAAIALVVAGAGGQEHVYAVISGHANPDHQAVPVPGGVSGSSLSVSVHARRLPGGES